MFLFLHLSIPWHRYQGQHFIFIIRFYLVLTITCGLLSSAHWVFLLSLSSLPSSFSLFAMGKRYTDSCVALYWRFLCYSYILFIHWFWWREKKILYRFDRLHHITTQVDSPLLQCVYVVVFFLLVYFITVDHLRLCSVTNIYKLWAYELRSVQMLIWFKFQNEKTQISLNYTSYSHLLSIFLRHEVDFSRPVVVLMQQAWWLLHCIRWCRQILWSVQAYTLDLL